MIAEILGYLVVAAAVALLRVVQTTRRRRFDPDAEYVEYAAREYGQRVRR